MIMTDKTVHYISNSREDTLEFGRSFSDHLRAGDVMTFRGTLGSGKTTLIQGLCLGLDVAELVTSPTFTLINEYNGRLPVYHFDFYRLGADQIDELGLDEYFYGEGVCLIEWPEIIESELPSHYYRAELSMKFVPGWQNKREIKITTR